MGRWRERAIREVRNELDRFLNYPINQSISLGDYGTYDNKWCRIQWEGNVADLGIKLESAGFQNEMAESYATADKVTIQGRLKFGNDHPAVEVKFSRARALAFRGYKIGVDRIEFGTMERAFSAAIRGGLQWDRKNVIVTELWRASGFTHLVAGSGNAGVQIEATAPSAAQMFNFADPSLGLNVLMERSMNYCAVGQTDVNPYFKLHKLRERAPGDWSFYRYG